MTEIMPFVIACRACWWQEPEYGWLSLDRLAVERCPQCGGRLVVLNWLATDAVPNGRSVAKQPPLLVALGGQP